MGDALSDCELVTPRDGACHWCGTILKGRQQRWCSRKCARMFTANHRWTQAKALAKQQATFYLCASCGGFFRQVEVNHITPIRGKHGTFGCHHHQHNLEVLCIPCHRDVTAKQRERGWT